MSSIKIFYSIKFNKNKYYIFNNRINLNIFYDLYFSY